MLIHTYKATQCHNAGDCNLNLHSCGNLTSNYKEMDQQLQTYHTLCTYLLQLLHVLQIKSDVEQGQERINKLELKQRCMSWLVGPPPPHSSTAQQEGPCDVRCGTNYWHLSHVELLTYVPAEHVTCISIKQHDPQLISQYNPRSHT
jgi:hypothetical protein